MDKLKVPQPCRRKLPQAGRVVPQCVAETIDEDGKVVRVINLGILQQEIATHVVEGREGRYQFTWLDKWKAILTANTPIDKPLWLCREECVGQDGTSGGFDSENLYIEDNNLGVLKLL